MRSLQSSVDASEYGLGMGWEGWPGRSWVWELGEGRDHGENGILAPVVLSRSPEPQSPAQKKGGHTSESRLFPPL